MLAAVLLCAIPMTGCLTWQPGWEGLPIRASGASAEQASREAELLLAEADSEQKVRVALAAWQRVLEADPGHQLALARIAELHVLLGAAYLDSRGAKGEAYLAGIRACERAMAANPEFAAAVKGGASVDEASRWLGREHAAAMFWWVTGVSYLFKECQTPLQRVVNFRWMKRTQGVLQRLTGKDAGFPEDAVQFTWGIFYLALPRSVGGDMTKSAAAFERAIEIAPTSLLNRWGRAKYFHAKAGDRAGFEADMRWVLAQDPRAASSAYRWSVYFQRDARRALGLADR